MRVLSVKNKAAICIVLVEGRCTDADLVGYIGSKEGAAARRGVVLGRQYAFKALSFAVAV